MADLPLQDKTILVLEDEFLIAMDIEEVCVANGASSVEIISRVPGNLSDMLGSRRFDAAVLDLKLGSASTLPVARKLSENGIPFIFATGYMAGEYDLADFAGVPVINKPFASADLVAALASAVDGSGHRS